MDKFTPDIRQELTDLVESLNTRMMEDPADSAETAFNISCFLSLIVIVVSTILALIFLHWVSAVILLVMTTMIATGISIFLAMRARSGNLVVTYNKVVEPQIETAMRQHDLTRPQFDEFAQSVLPAGAPLNHFLSPSPPPESGPKNSN